MGHIRPSIRTLPTGERVWHFPDGHQELIPENSPLGDFLDSHEEDIQAANDRLAQARLDTIAAKQEEMESGEAVPNDKRPI